MGSLPPTETSRQRAERQLSELEARKSSVGNTDKDKDIQNVLKKVKKTSKKKNRRDARAVEKSLERLEQFESNVQKSWEKKERVQERKVCICYIIISTRSTVLIGNRKIGRK